MFTEHIHISEVYLRSVLQTKKLRLRDLSASASRKEHWAGGLGELVSHPGIATSLLWALGKTQPVSGAGLPSGVEQLISFLARIWMAPHERQVPGGRPYTGCWVSRLLIQCSYLWLFSLSLLQGPMSCLLDFSKVIATRGLAWNGVFLWLCLACKGSVPASEVSGLSEQLRQSLSDRDLLVGQK